MCPGDTGSPETDPTDADRSDRGRTHGPHLDHEATIDALETELTRTVQLADTTPVDLAIPTCPEWTASQLWEHLGTVHRWVTEIVVQRATEPVSRRGLELDLPGDDLWSPWMADGADRLLAALRDTAAGDPVWTWGADHNAGWWARRQLHETVVHDADAALALGEDFEVPAAIAADGICELLDNVEARLQWPGARRPEVQMTIHLHATDPPDPTDPDAGAAGLADLGELMVSIADGRVSYDHGHGKGDVAVRAPVTALMLLVNRRLDPDSLATFAPGSEIFGDPEVLDAALESLAHG